MNTKWKVILSVMLLILTICAIFTGLMLKNCSDNLVQYINGQVKSAQVVSQIIEEQKSSQYRQRIKSLVTPKMSASRDEMLQAFARQDRKALQRLSLPFLTILKKESPHFSTFGWVLPDNHAFLRVHDPEDFGEDVSTMRPDIVAAGQQRTQLAGFTAGYVGLQYRIVQPVTYNGRFLGTIQFGLQDSLLLDPVREKLEIPVGLVLPNEKLKYVKHSELSNLPGKTHTIQTRDVELFQGSEDTIDWTQKQQRIQLNGKDYIIAKVLELRNFEGIPQGDLFVALDISASTLKKQALLWSALSLSGLILLLSYLILNSSYEALVQKIVNLNTSLEQSNALLEERVKKRTGKLLREIEDRKIAERERAIAETKVQRSSKMEAIGLMAGGVAHDLNNILSGIVTYPEILLLRLPEDSDLRKPIQTIHDSGKRAAEIVADLLTVARGVASEKIIVNLNSLAGEYFVSPEYNHTRDEHPQISYSLDCDPDLFNISCSPVHLKKCMMNLVNNGSEAIHGDGTITVATCNRYVDKPVAKNQYMEKGEYVVLTVSDTGSGIARQDQEHIFEPFYTKKKMGRSGTGLGLAIVWNTVHDHDGAVTIVSDEKGTTFELYFPSVRKDVTLEASKSDLSDLQGNNELVLVVDDEPQQREIASEMLSLLGYRVETVQSGADAVAFVKEKQVDLLILDMIMDPGINGQQTYKQINELYPGQKAIIASGFSETEDVKATLLLGAGFFIRKPYTMFQLGLAARQVLGS